MDKVIVDAQVQALIAQRDANANQVVMMAGELAKVNAELAALKEANQKGTDDVSGESV